MLTHSPFLYQTTAIRQLEETATNKYQISVETLMQRAGAAAFRVLQQEFPRARRIVVVCGKGNNAGDGYVLALAALRAGYSVRVLNIVPITGLKGAARSAAEAYAAAARESGSEDDLSVVANIDSAALCAADVIIDALLGTGLQGELQQVYVNAIKLINAACNSSGALKPVLALDLPSGLLADSGAVAHDATTVAGGEKREKIAVRAHVTVTFLGLKCGLFTNDGVEFCGKIICDDLDMPPEIFSTVTPFAQLLDWAELRRTLLPMMRRQRNAHKGSFGHVIVLGGDYNMGGAVRIAAEGAARAGAGLVSIGTRHEHISAINAARPEIMCYEIKSAQDIADLWARATCVVVGPGLGQGAWGKMIFAAVLDLNARAPLPMVIDADALNLLAGSEEEVKSAWRSGGADVVLTPHPGEAARLLGLSDSTLIQSDRYAAALELQRKYQATIVLKGAGTLIAAVAPRQDEASTTKSAKERVREGEAEVVELKVCPNGNPGMASGGMGDLLSGVISALLAQNLCARAAAEFGVCAHAMAGDIAACDGGGERGLLALDLLPQIRRLLN